MYYNQPVEKNLLLHNCGGMNIYGGEQNMNKKSILVAAIMSIFALQCPNYTLADDEDSSEVYIEDQADSDASEVSAPVKQEKKKKKKDKKKNKSKSKKAPKKAPKNTPKKRENVRPPEPDNEPESEDE
jgi:stringent starvation protein B